MSLLVWSHARIEAQADLMCEVTPSLYPSSAAPLYAGRTQRACTLRWCTGRRCIARNTSLP